MARKPQRNVQVFSVGGSVRDELLGRRQADRDWVVVGATPEIMLASGYRPVGRDFPVFLHPGHARGIRARAHRAQARHRLPRLRVLRVAGRHARGGSRAPRPHDQRDGARRGRRADRSVRRRSATCARRRPAPRVAGVRRGPAARAARRALRRALRLRRRPRDRGADARASSRAGELATLAPERVWQELARGLHGGAAVADARRAARLRRARRAAAGGRRAVRRAAAAGAPSRGRRRRARRAARSTTRPRTAFDLAARYAVLAHDLGKGTTPRDAWPRHVAHEARGVRLAERAVDAPQRARRLPRRRAARGALAPRRRATPNLRPATAARPAACAIDALRRPERLDALLRGAAQRGRKSRRGAAMRRRALSAGAIVARAGARRSSAERVEAARGGRASGRGSARGSAIGDGESAKAGARRRGSRALRRSGRRGRGAIEPRHRPTFRRGTRPPSSRRPPARITRGPAAARRRRPGLLRHRAVARLVVAHLRRRSRGSSRRRRGSASMWPVRCSSTWRSVSTTKPRLTRSPASPAATPIANEPAYHSGLSSDVPVGELGEARLRPREVLLLVARGRREALADVGVARDQRLRGVERLRADFAGVVDAHQPRGVRGARASSQLGSAIAAPGTGRAVVATPASVRSARSKPMIRCGASRSAGSCVMSTRPWQPCDPIAGVAQSIARTGRAPHAEADR